MSNIHGLGSVKKTDGKKDVEEFTVGGGSSSTSVLRPTSTGNRPAAATSGGANHSIAGDIIQKARDNAASSGGARAGSAVAEIILYSNGFLLGGAKSNDFRDSSDPKNAKFLQEIKEGYLPKELEESLRNNMIAAGTPMPSGGQVGINIIDKSREKFEPPKQEKKYDFSKGTGQSIASYSSSTSSNGGGSGVFSAATPQKVTVDSSQPTTILQLILHPRERVKETFNHSHTVLQIYQHIAAISGQTKFEMLAGFPPRPLTNPSATIKDAGLVGASVQQKL